MTFGEMEVCSCGNIISGAGREAAKQGELHYPTAGSMSDKYPKHKTEPQKSSKTPGEGGGQGPPANLSSPRPTVAQPTGSSHRKGLG